MQGSLNPQNCPAGSYCPEGTKFGTQYICPSGTFSDSTNLSNRTQCTPCTPGKYCGTSGLTEPTANCQGGFFCGGGSSVATPFQSGSYNITYVGETCVALRNNTINDICPPGHYCPEGTDAPKQCPPGTNSSSFGLVVVADCPPCSKGYYCPLNGTVLAARKCLSGFFCPPGTTDPTTIDILSCPTGSRCPEGSTFPMQCDPGQYQNARGQTFCKVNSKISIFSFSFKVIEPIL